MEGEAQYRGERLRKEGGEATRRPKCTSAYLHMMIDRSTYRVVHKDWPGTKWPRMT